VSVSAEQISTHGDEDHGLGDVDPGLIVSHEAPPPCHPAECSLHDPAARQNLKANLFIGTADDLDDELKLGRLVHELQPIVGKRQAEAVQAL
jgi:hypothetical protein